MSSIQFFSEDIPFTLKKKTALREWIKDSVLSENQSVRNISFIFCSDEYLLNINKTYLHHNTYTDIITFDNGDEENRLSGDIFISIERVRDNAKKFSVPETDELHRVMIHGVLHLLGYKDKSKHDKDAMTSREDLYLKKRTFV